MKRFIYVWVAAMLLITLLVSYTLAYQEVANEPPAVEEDGDVIGGDIERVTEPYVGPQLVLISDRFVASQTVDQAIFTPQTKIKAGSHCAMRLNPPAESPAPPAAPE